jgi:predicted DNA-binding transcriptional regulator AlpA
MNNEKENGDTVFSRKEAAKYLTISFPTLDALPIPKIKLSRRVLYRKSAVDAWLERKERESRGQRV